MLQSIMEMQKTQGQLVEAVQSLRESQRETHTRVDTLGHQVGSLSQRVGAVEHTVETLSDDVVTLSGAVGTVSRQIGAIDQKLHAAQTVMCVVGAGLASMLGVVGWLVTNAIAMLPSLLNAN